MDVSLLKVSVSCRCSMHDPNQKCKILALIISPRDLWLAIALHGEGLRIFFALDMNRAEMPYLGIRSTINNRSFVSEDRRTNRCNMDKRVGSPM